MYCDCLTPIVQHAKLWCCRGVGNEEAVLHGTHSLCICVFMYCEESLRFSVSFGPPGLLINPVTGFMQITPTYVSNQSASVYASYTNSDLVMIHTTSVA